MAMHGKPNGDARRRKQSTGIAGILIALVTIAPSLEQAMSADLPQFHGVYATSGAKLIKLEPGELPELDSKSEILVFDKAYARLPANSFQIRTVSKVRYKVIGTAFAPVDLSKGLNGITLVSANEWRFIKGQSPIIKFGSKGVNGEPDMVQLVPEKQLAPAVYELVIEALPKGFAARFVVDSKKLDKSNSVDVYIDNAQLNLLGQFGGDDVGTFHPTKKLDPFLFEKWRRLLAPFEKRDVVTKRGHEEFEKRAEARERGLVRAAEIKKLRADIVRTMLAKELKKSTIHSAELLRIDPNNVDTLQGLALIKASLGELDQAVENATKSLTLTMDARMLLLVSVCYSAEQKTEESLFWFQKALKSEFDNRELIKKLYGEEFPDPRYKILIDRRFEGIPGEERNP